MQSFANKAVFFQATNGVQKKNKSLFLDPTKNLKLRMACGLEKDVPGSEKREAAYLSLSGIGPSTYPASTFFKFAFKTPASMTGSFEALTVASLSFKTSRFDKSSLLSTGTRCSHVVAKRKLRMNCAIRSRLHAQARLLCKFDMSEQHLSRL